MSMRLAFPSASCVCAGLLTLLLSVPLSAQQLPSGLQPLPIPPAMPAGVEGGVEAEGFEPEVTIENRGEDTVEEYRHNGRLYMVKVTPPHGTPYYLVDRKGDGVLVRQDVAPGTVVPMWVIGTW